MSTLKYLDLPSITEELIEPIDIIINKPPKPGSNIPSTYQYFQTRLVSEELFSWVNEMFGRDCYTQYQIIREGLPAHKDVGRNVAFNYVIQLGGENPNTNIYDSNKNLIYSETVPLKRWHMLKTDEYHTATNLITERVAISVEVLGYVWGEKL